jgi:hypothetical protein
MYIIQLLYGETQIVVEEKHTHIAKLKKTTHYLFYKKYQNELENAMNLSFF